MKYILDLDRPRELHFNLASYSLIKELTGVKKLGSLLKLKISWIPVLAWIGLVQEDPDLKLEEVQKLIEQKTKSNEEAMGYVALTVLEAIRGCALSLPLPEKKRAKFKIPRGGKRR